MTRTPELPLVLDFENQLKELLSELSDVTSELGQMRWIGVAKNIETFSLYKMIEAEVAVVGTTGDYAVIVYRNVHGSELGYAIFDEDRETCVELSILEILFMMLPDEEPDRVQLNLVHLMIGKVSNLAR